MCSIQTLIERKVHLLKVIGSFQKVVVEISNNKNLMSEKDLFALEKLVPSDSRFPVWNLNSNTNPSESHKIELDPL